jgi:hypothetical protein
MSHQRTTVLQVQGNGQVLVEEQHRHPNGRITIHRVVAHQTPTTEWLQNVMPALDTGDLFDSLGLQHLPARLLEQLVREYAHHLPDTQAAPATLELAKYNTLARRRVKKAHNLGAFNEDTCTICMAPWKLRESVTTLPCGHEFHHRCVRKWLTKKKATCPVCRRDTTT